VAASESFGSEQVRRLAWTLEGSGVAIALVPALTDVAGPRIHIRPVAGLPLMYVEEARFSGPKLVAKTVVDVIGSSLALILLSPLLVVVALAIKLGDRGPVFFRQQRVGLAGQSFRVWKFRSMIVGADAKISEARQTAAQPDDVFYKSAADPRITPIGRFIRRTSIDELPQLFNVLAGQMSIVGPRPLVPGEGAEVGNFLERRMLVRPGITGLWQVSGRSNVQAEERIRMDFYYVENWSFAGDLVIMARTVRAVLSQRGAY
jgi:exopolysaccharide biosynthesis polyprenyl glycosylphosphotransferase